MENGMGVEKPAFSMVLVALSATPFDRIDTYLCRDLEGNNKMTNRGQQIGLVFIDWPTGHWKDGSSTSDVFELVRES